MSAVRQFARPILSVVLLTVTVLGLINVYGDNDAVMRQAKQTACGGSECPTQVTRLERTPLAQTYDIVAESKGPPKGGTRTVTVRCARAQILIGDWECVPQK